jgi:hypothetical protein
MSTLEYAKPLSWYRRRGGKWVIVLACVIALALSAVVGVYVVRRELAARRAAEAAALVEQAKVEAGKGEYQKALSLLESSVVLNPRNGEAIALRHLLNEEFTEQLSREEAERVRRSKRGDR